MRIVIVAREALNISVSIMTPRRDIWKFKGILCDVYFFFL